jgi:imidazolonepropionase-like amidohydrolase
LKYHILLLYLLLALSLHAQEPKAILCGQLISGTDSAPLPNAVVRVEGERIIEVGFRDAIRPGDQLIDLSGYTVMPGLIDAHTHPLIFGDDYQGNHLRNSSAAKALRGLKTVQAWLEEGWTSIRVAGDADIGYAQFEIRDAINSGMFEGPRIFGAGHYLSVTGGGGDINNYSYEQLLIPDGLIVNGPEEVQKAIRNEIKYGSDWIKLLVTGAFMSAGDNPQNVHFSDEELKAGMDEATRRGIPVMAHAHATDGIKKAIRFGVRSVEHGTFLDDECIDLFLENGTYLIPTLYVGEYMLNELPDSKALSKANQIYTKYREPIREAFRKAVKRGVKIGVGSDNVGMPPNFAAREFGELVSLGMTPMQAIIAGTRVNAELLMMDRDIGTIEVGKYADIIATKDDPIGDISALERVGFVMKGGAIIKQVK